MLPSGDVLPLSRRSGSSVVSESGTAVDTHGDIDTHSVRRAHSVMGGNSPFSGLAKQGGSGSSWNAASESPLLQSRQLASVISGEISQGETPDSGMSLCSG